jgi:hypothetical protein
MNTKLKYGLTLTIAVLIVAIVREIIKEYMIKDQKSESAISIKPLVSEKPWFTGVYSGIKISTPEKLKENPYVMSEYEKTVASKVGSHEYLAKEICILVHYLKYLRNDIDYDIEYGLKTGISNGVNGLGGTNLQFNLVDSHDKNKRESSGTFIIEGEMKEYKEVGYYNGKGEVGVVIIYGPKSKETDLMMAKIINSLEYLF